MPSQICRVSPPEDERTAKRRKVRKGTQSCWECKKRKVRCIWGEKGDICCDNCSRRGSRCVGQEYADEPEEGKEMGKGDGGMEERMKKVEEVVEQLVQDAGMTCLYRQTENLAYQLRDSTSTNSMPISEVALTPKITLLPSDTSLSGRYTGLARDLVGAWPNQHDLDHIYQLPIGLSTHLHMKLCASPSALPSQEPISPQAMLQLPSPGSHPVLMARKLLILGSLLQGAFSDSHQAFGDMRDHFSEIMTRAVDTAARLVTSNDELTASVEGIECIMIEAMIQNYAGNLHRAWMTARRATTVAQMVGLHRGSKTPKVLDAGTTAGFDPGHLCFRIVEMDRYLSITLGLPQSSLETWAVTPEALASCGPLDRMGRLHCIIAGRILTRQSGEKSRGELLDMEDIDQMLQSAAAEMSSQWWLVPHYGASRDNTLDPFYEVARTMYQLSHYHLLIRLHLPYMLRSWKDNRFDHSKITAVNASRELLSRYIAFRGWNPGHYYCRGIDFLSFIALTSLCLAHIDSRNSTRTSPEVAQSGTNASCVLARSHPSDRGLMERTFSILAAMENDTIAAKLSSIMYHLLDVEAASANGVEYSAATTEDHDGALTECDGEFINGQNTLQLHIPYFGTINFQRRLVCRPAEGMIGLCSTLTTSNDVRPEQAVQQDQSISSEWSLLNSTDDMGALDDWTMQSINEGLFNSLFSGLGDKDTTYDTWTPLNSYKYRIFL
ncbi:hypothetical protein EJ02DRAFT_446290 [Clathrospora elynae]|uniref:Zn(2)-C6 fungal-type domain-containing protein n=1 Tax=Clathrospora elynae TaxID=706981 RepID=A0A6A5SGX4_9PLEO|nr:hypothetical protein EJ02DRAFT_446290 [Clathrospora elynae]